MATGARPFAYPVQRVRPKSLADIIGWMQSTVRTPRLGLRERKKKRTRQTILDVATRLFAEQGYEATTVAQITDRAEIAPSTFFKYFPVKADIVFAPLDAVVESAKERVLGRSLEEPAIDALLVWVREVLPGVEAPYAGILRDIPRILGSNPALQAEQRLRIALFEDVLAGAFARDLGETSDGIRARVMAAIAVRGMVAIWSSWWEAHASDLDFDPTQVFALKADYLDRALNAGLVAIEALPTPEV